MRRGFIYLILFLLLLALPFVVQRLRLYSLTTPEREPVPDYNLDDVADRVPTPASSEFVDEPEAGEGLVLLDYAHNNDFQLSEISYLDSRLAARGFELTAYEDGDLTSALRPVDAFVVIAPLNSFEPGEVQAVSEYVSRGGRLLMVGDPTRFTLGFDEESFGFNFTIDSDQIPLNSLANEFDLVFNGDYLYNTIENEGNFRNILLKGAGFAESDLTDGLDQLAFYGSHSVQVGTSSRPLLSADDDTWSSATDRPGGLALAALSEDDRVLAVGDIDFLAEPYHTVYDNSRFIAQIADFLTGTERDYVLTDFPYFYEENIDLNYVGDPELGPDAFDEIIELQDTFRQVGIGLALVDQPSGEHDVLYLGLYNQAEEVQDMLDAAGIELLIDPPIETGVTEENAESEIEEIVEEDEKTRLIESTLGNIQMSGTSIILLETEDDRRNVVVLAASNDGLESTIDRLIDLMPMNADYALSDCLLQGGLALCPTGVDDEPVEAQLETGGSPDVARAEEEEESESDGEGSEEVDFGADYQGGISLGETVEGSLAAGEAHSWVFKEGPAVINAILQGSDDMDGVIELYNPDGNLMVVADSTLNGGEERLEFIDIPDDGAYTIVVRDFFDEGGDYSLSVESANPDDLNISFQGELPFDETVEGVLAEGETYTWSFTVDEPISVTITLQSGPDVDGVLIIFDQDENLIDIVDETLEGEAEILEAVHLAAAGDTVVVGDYMEDGGEYELLLTRTDGVVAAGGGERVGPQEGWIETTLYVLEQELYAAT